MAEPAVQIVSRLLLGASLVLVFVTSWTVLPAPNRPLLVASIVATELSVWFVIAGFAVCAVTLGVAGRDLLAHVTFGLAVVATVLASLPLARVPFAVRRFNATMGAAIGPGRPASEPAAQMSSAGRAAPVVVLDLLRGLPTGSPRITRGIPFATPGGVTLTLDVYRPVDDGPRPAIVQIYGGAWQRGAPADDGWFAEYFAARGFVVFAIDYRHAPQWRWPAQIEDVREALRWIWGHGAEHGADPSRLALVGRSAGAQLAMVAAWEPGAPAIAAVVNYYGPVDLAGGYRNPPRPDPLGVRAIDEAFVGGTPDEMPDRYRAASPITYVTGRVPPTLLVYGGRDHVLSPGFGARLDQRLRAAGATSVFLEIPWAEHAFDAVPHGPSGQLALYYTERFLAWAMRADRH